MATADHFAYAVSDMDRSIEFYTQVLGLKLLSNNFDEAHQEKYAFLELEGANLELVQALEYPLEPQAARPPYCPHLALSTDDMDATLAMIEARSIPVVKGPLEIPGEVKWIYLRDPDNNVIEFVEWDRYH